MLKRLFKYTAAGVVVGGVSTQFLPKQTQYDIYGNLFSFTNFFRAGYVFAISGYEYQTELEPFAAESEEYSEKQKEIHTRVAKRLLKLSQTNRGIYLKFGQYLGNLERLIPK